MSEEPSPTAPSFLDKIRESVKSRYFIIKELEQRHDSAEGVAGPAVGTDGHIFFCLSKRHFTPHNMQRRDATALRSQILVVKAPREPEAVRDFLQEVEIMLKLRFVHGCIEVKDTAPTADAPWFSMPFIRGGTLWTVLDKLAPLGQHDTLPPALIWHITSSLLTIILRLRCDLEPDPNAADPILHSDIHGSQIMFDPSSCTYPPFPDIKLIDFGRAWTGARDPPGANGRGHYRRNHQVDLEAVGAILHQLGHEKHYTSQNRSILYKSLRESNRCNCIPLPYTPNRGGLWREFGVYDFEFDDIVRKLAGPKSNKLESKDVAELARIARRRSQEALQRTGRVGEVLDPKDWDTAVADFPDEVIRKPQGQPPKARSCLADKKKSMEMERIQRRKMPFR